MASAKAQQTITFQLPMASSSSVPASEEVPDVPETLMKMALQLTPQKDRSQLLGRILDQEEGDDVEVNDILDDLMRELPVGKDAKGKGRGKAATDVKKSVPAKPRVTAKIAAGTQKRPNASAAAGPKSKRVKKEAEDVPKKKTQSKKAVESSDDDDDEEEEDDVIDLEESSDGNDYDSDELEEEEEEEEDSSDEDGGEEEENVPAGGNLKNAKKIAILAKDLTTPVRAIMLSQCKQCQLAQKEVVNPISSIASDELFLNLAVCKSCIEGNVQQLNLHKRYFGGQKPVKLFPQAVETKKPKKKKYIPEGDDYKCTSGRFHVTIGQCGTCAARQRALSAELFLAKGPGRTRLCAYAQCLTCLGGNKQLQSAYWRFWSIFADKAGKGGKGKK